MSGRRRPKHRKPRFHRRTAPGAPPGTLAVDPCAARPKVSVVTFGGEHFEERSLDDLSVLEPPSDASQVMWVNVEGLGDADTIRDLGKIFRLHPLALEDVVNVHQRAKVEHYGDHVFIVARMLKSSFPLATEQVSIFVGRDFVLTFIEDPGDSFDPVRQRLRASGTIRAHGAGYLAYALLDAIVDAYFPLLEEMGDRMDALEDRLAERPSVGTITAVHDIKRDLRTLRRVMWPLRESLHQCSREQSAFFNDETRVYLRDCHDHTVQILDLVETYRELGADMSDLYLSSLSNRLNEIMKVLAIISTLFMPLSFIAGIYGMNFDPSASPYNMPELEWRYGYAAVLAVMVVVALCMFVWFFHRGWIGGGNGKRASDNGGDAHTHDDAQSEAPRGGEHRRPLVRR